MDQKQNRSTNPRSWPVGNKSKHKLKTQKIQIWDIKHDKSIPIDGMF